MRYELPGNCSGPWPRDCFDSLFFAFSLGPRCPEETFPRHHRPPVSGSHSHQSNGEVNYLPHTQWAYLVVSYLYLKKIGLSRINFPNIYLTYCIYYDNLVHSHCGIFRNGNCQRFFALFFI